nr:MAG TPA: hypothetical protein [Caudoviricetes sp.]
MHEHTISKFDIVTFKNIEFKEFELIDDYFLVTNVNNEKDICEVRALTGFLHKGSNSPIFKIKKQYLDKLLIDSNEFKRNLEILETADDRNYVDKNYPFQILDIVTIKPEWLNPKEENQYYVIVHINDGTGRLELTPLTGYLIKNSLGSISPCHKDYVIKHVNNENLLIAIYKLLKEQKFL